MKNSIQQVVSKRLIIVYCILSSIILHLTLIYFYYKHPLSIYASSVFHRSKPKPTAILSENQGLEDISDSFLAESLNQIVLVSKTAPFPYDFASLVSPAGFSPTSERVPLSPSIEINYKLFSDPISDQEIFLSKEITFESKFIDSLNLIPPSPYTQNAERFSFPISQLKIEHTLDSLPTLSFVDKESSHYFENDFAPYDHSVNNPIFEKETPSFFTSLAGDISSLKNEFDAIHIPTKHLDWSKKEITSPHHESTLKELTKREVTLSYNLSSEAPYSDDELVKMTNVTTWSDSFNVQVSISPPTDEDGYIFSLALTPKQSMAYEKIPQNFYFLIDPTSSIDRHKFSLFKRATLKSLSSLQQGDRFNIIILDKKLSRLGSKNLMFSSKSLQIAEEFLEKISQASFITSHDFIESVQKFTSEIKNEEQMHTAILLTNGVSSQGFQNQQKSIKSFLQNNACHLTIYAAAVGTKNNLMNIDMLCSISGGKLLYSDTNAAFPRKLSSLVKNLRNPIAKDIRITATATNPKAKISLLSSTKQLAPLYDQEPYVIMGRMDRLSDIQLCIEARHESEWINIEKMVSFNEANLDSKILLMWSKAQIHSQYQAFLNEPKAKHLKKAKELLQSIYGKGALE